MTAGLAARQAPNLATFGEREKVAGVLDHYGRECEEMDQGSQKYKPGNTMTGTYGELSDSDINALAAYLLELKVEDK